MEGERREWQVLMRRCGAWIKKDRDVDLRPMSGTYRKGREMERSCAGLLLQEEERGHEDFVSYGHWLLKCREKEGDRGCWALENSEKMKSRLGLVLAAAVRVNVGVEFRISCFLGLGFHTPKL